MSFSLATFQKLMSLTQAATQEASSVVDEWGGGDHVGAVQTAVQTAGAIAQSSTTDTQVQQEAAGATQLAVTLLPLIFSFASFFAKKKPATGTANVPAPATAG